MRINEHHYVNKDINASESASLKICVRGPLAGKREVEILVIVTLKIDSNSNVCWPGIKKKSDY